MFDKNKPLFDQQKTLLLAFFIFIFSLAVALSYGYRFIFPFSVERDRGAQDFIVFYTASSMSINGEAQSVYDEKVFNARQNEIAPGTTGLPWLYPPTYLLMTAPLALTDIVSSRLLFFGISLVLFLYASRNWICWRYSWLMVIGFGPVLMNFCIGQNGLYTVSFILLALQFIRSHAWISGLCISLLLIKPQLGIFIPIILLAGREYRVFFWSCLFSLVFLFSSVMVFGFDSWRGFFLNGELIREHVSISDFPVHLMASALASVVQFGYEFKFAMLIHVIYAVPFLVATLMAWRKTDDILLKGASLGLLTIVASPYILEYDLAWLALPIGMLGLHARNHGWLPGESLVLVVSWLLPLVDFMGAVFGSREWFPYNIWPLTNLALLIVIVRRLRRVINASDKDRGRQSNYFRSVPCESA